MMKMSNFTKNYLTDRMQVTIIGAIIYDERFVNSQEGVLGPLLFVKYINDLLQLPFHSSSFVFADDRPFVCCAKNKDL